MVSHALNLVNPSREMRMASVLSDHGWASLFSCHDPDSVEEQASAVKIPAR